MQLIHANIGGERITGVPKDCLVSINGHGFSNFHGTVCQTLPDML